MADEFASMTRPPVPVITPILRRWLRLVLGLFALLALNSVYLVTITLTEQVTGRSYQDFVYLSMFLGHLVLGLALILPFLWFGINHLRRGRRRANRNAVRAGLGLFVAGLAVLLSGVVLTRFGLFEVNHPQVRALAYWVHVAAPLVVVWLFVLHRLAGRRLRWRLGVAWAGACVGFAAIMLGWHTLGPGQAQTPAAPAFATTLLQTPGGEHLAAEPFMTDHFCAECHADIAADWRMSAHRLSSFNNPFYSFSVQETRQVSMQTQGSVEKAQFCAGCHDIVPLVSGRFDDPDFDIVKDPTAHAGLTCTSCHAISRVNSVLGNADFTLTEPVRYPFEDSDNGFLREVSKQLIKAKPAYHKQGFLKPVHKTAQFCATCHKAHLPVTVNDYKWLRAQNHYDSFQQSGVPGHRVDSFYYPPKAIKACAACHMPLRVSGDPAARDFAGDGTRQVHSHLFPAANTALGQVLDLPEAALAAHRGMLEGAVRLDIFGVREGGEVDGRLHAPLDAPQPVQLQPGERYLIEAVVRNLRVGHHLTQGTADSNELWIDVTVKAGDRVVGRSGALGPDGAVDPWSFFINTYVLTKAGERLDRRNGQDTYAVLYSHQIPPGAAAVVHYAIRIPEEVAGPLTIDAAVRYRKFDATYLKHVQGEDFRGNDLPITTLASDRVQLAVGAAAADTPLGVSAETPLWERWNDYGIGLLLSGEANKSTLRQAEAAFREVEALGRPDGPLNLARAYLKEGRVDAAADALARLAESHPDFRPWTRAWLTALVDRENGHLDQTIVTLRALLATQFNEARARGFDFGQDYRARGLLGRTLYERSRLERGPQRVGKREALLREALAELQVVLEQDPENLTAHHNLALIHANLGDQDAAVRHRRLREKYRPDDHAAEMAVATHRRANPAADHAAEPVAIYNLQRPRAFGLPPVDHLAGEVPGEPLTDRKAANADSHERNI